MEIQYRNTFADLIKFNLYLLPRLWSMRVMAALWLLLLGWPIYVAWQKSEKTFFHLVVFIFMVVILLLFWFLFMFVGILVSYVPKQNKSFLTDHRVSVTETGVAEETDLTRTEYKWRGITNVAQNRDYIFVFVSQYGAHVIPNHAFSDSAHRNAFYDSVYGRWQASRQS